MEKVPAQAESMLGTMDADKLMQKWLRPVCQCCEAISCCDNLQALGAAFPELQQEFPEESRLTPEQTASDVGQCLPLLGRQFVLMMDGAKYNCRKAPGFIPR